MPSPTFVGGAEAAVAELLPFVTVGVVFFVVVLVVLVFLP